MPKSRAAPAKSNGRVSADPHALFAKTRAQLAWCFGVSVQVVYKWRDNGAPKKTTRGYDLAAYIAWRVQRGVVAPVNERQVLDCRLKRVRLSSELLELKRKRGEVIDRREAEEGRLAIVQWTCGVMDRAGSELGSRVSGRKLAEVKRVVDSYFREVRREAAEQSR